MIRGLLIVALLLLAINGAYVIVSPVVKNSMLQGRMYELAKNRGMKSDADLRAEILDYAMEKDIPLNPRSLIVQTQRGDTVIAGRYRVRTTFLFYTHDYEFYPASKKSASLAEKRAWFRSPSMMP